MRIQPFAGILAHQRPRSVSCAYLLRSLEWSQKGHPTQRYNADSLNAGITSIFTSTSPRMHSTLRTSHFLRSFRSVTSPVCSLARTFA
jgi:hypothetical protein